MVEWVCFGNGGGVEVAFIDSLILKTLKKKFDDNQFLILKNMLDTFSIYGQYLNSIPDAYHVNIIDDLSSELFYYSLSLSIYLEKTNRKMPKQNKTLAPSVLIEQDIKILKKAQTLIRDKILNKYLYAKSITTKEVNYSREKNDEWYLKIKELHKDGIRGDVLENNEIDKKAYDTYYNLQEIIEDLELIDFKFFFEHNYYPPQKPNKEEIKFILAKVRKQFNLKSSLDEKQLIDNL